MRKSILESSLWVLVMAFCLLLGCAVKVSQSDLVGSWQMTDESLRLLKPVLTNGQRPRLELRADSSLLADNLPTTGFGDIQRWQRLYSGTGKWSVPPVRRTEGFSRIVLEFDAGRDQGPSGLIMQVDKDSSGFYIFVWLDEEGGERLRFKR